MAADRILLVLSYSLVAVISISTGQQALPYTCPPAASSGYVYRSSCYDFVGTEATWTTARLRCRSRGGRLVMVTDAALQSWLSSKAAEQFPSRQGVWLGLHDRRTEGVFYWDNYDGNDQPATYFYWAAGEPNNKLGNQDCAYMRRSYDWRWVDIECSLSLIREYSHICEFRGVAPANPTSTQQQSTTKSSLSSPTALAGQTTFAASSILSSSKSVWNVTEESISIPEENNSIPDDRLDNRHHMMTDDNSPGQSSVSEPAALSSAETALVTATHSGENSYTLNTDTLHQVVTASSKRPAQSSTAVPATLSTAEPALVSGTHSGRSNHTLNLDTLHQDKTASSKESPAEVSPYSDAVKEAQDAARQSQTVHVAIAIIVILAVGIPILVFLLMRRRRRLRYLKEGNSSPAVSYTGTGVHGLENPMYCSPLALSADAATSPLLAVGTTVLAPSNVYADMDALAHGEDSLQRYESAGGYPIYAEPFQHQSNCRSAADDRDGEPAVAAAHDSPAQLPHVYAECMPPPEAELNDLSKDCDPDRPAARGFGKLQLNVDGDCVAAVSSEGGYEEYRSQWNAYENAVKPGSRPTTSS